MTYQERFLSLRLETRKLRQDCSTFFRAWESQKEKSKRLTMENSKLKKENKDLNEKLEDALKQLDHEIEVKEKYWGMIYKSAKKVSVNLKTTEEKRRRGGQFGHIGVSRVKPTRIDQEKEVYLCACPHCLNNLAKSNNFYERIVEDIQFYSKTIITKYHIQRQWCSHCQKEVHGAAEGTIENSPFGINILIWILIPSQI